MKTVFTPVNLLQRLFLVLYESARPISKFNLAKTVGSTESSIANYLPDLTKPGWVSESNGMYVITAAGRKRFEEDPYVVPKKRASANWRNELPWSYIKENSACRFVLDTEFSDEMKEIFKVEMLPLVLLWLVSNGYKFPFQDEFKKTDKDEPRAELLSSFVTSLVDMYSTKEDVKETKQSLQDGEYYICSTCERTGNPFKNKNIESHNETCHNNPSYTSYIGPLDED